MEICGFSLVESEADRQSADVPEMKREDDATLSVTQLMRRMRNVLEIGVGEIWVEGEVSNLRKQGSGHWYFSLKDEAAQVSCVMFGARRREGADALEDGAKVRVFAEASVYEARGQLQVIVKKAERAGAGDLQAKFEALKRKLQAEGLFDAARKKEVPGFPMVVGIVTSQVGAALQDILNVLGRRAPWVKPVLCPVRVQGKGAELEIADAVRMMGREGQCDVLIVGRGGGSMEDLWNFNEEVVARAIAASEVPVISAVGHEIDFTIADFVADLRAPTPSAAAEMAVPDGAELATWLEGMKRRLSRVVRERVERAGDVLEGYRRGVLRRDGERILREPVQRVDVLRASLERGVKGGYEEAVGLLRELGNLHRARRPAVIVERRIERLERLANRLAQAAANSMEGKTTQLEKLQAMLRTLGPESAFQRGFSITIGPDGQVLRSVQEVKEGDRLRTKFRDGELSSVVEK